MGLQRVGHDLATHTHTHTHTAFLMLRGSQFGIPNWNQIFVTLEINS